MIGGYQEVCAGGRGGFREGEIGEGTGGGKPKGGSSIQVLRMDGEDCAGLCWSPSMSLYRDAHKM